MSHPKQLAIALLLVATVVAIAHAPALTAQAFAFDDGEYLQENRLVQNPSWNSARRFLTEVFRPSTVHGYYQPLTMISLMLDHAMGGRDNDLRIFHRTSLALHVANTVLMGIVVYLLLRRPLPAAAAALLWGLHPLTVEPIPWIGERKTVLAAFFSLTSLALYVRHARSPHVATYVGALAAYALALLAKPTATPLPLVMLLLDHWPLARLNRRALVEKIPFAIIGGASAIVTYLSQKWTHHALTPGDFPWTHVPLRICHNIVFYLSNVLWPRNLTVVYPMPAPFDLSNRAVWMGVAGTVVILAALALAWRRWRPLPVGWLIFILLLFPTMGPVVFTTVVGADKYTYLPMFGLVLIVAWALDQAGLGRTNRARSLGIAALVVAIAAVEFGLTRLQLTYWQDPLSLFTRMARLAPRDDLVHFGLGESYRQRNRLPEAEAELRIAVELEPRRAMSWDMLGVILTQRGKPDAAIACHRRALDVEIGVPAVASWHGLGLALAALNRHDEAIDAYQQALAMDPAHPAARNNLAASLIALGRTDEAEALLNALLADRPDHGPARLQRARLLAKRGDAATARRELEETVRRAPDFADGHDALARVLAAAGEMDAALRHAQSAVDLKPASAPMMNNLAVLLARAGRLDEAGTMFERVLQANPKDAEAHHNLALTLRDRDRAAEALSHWAVAVQLRPDHPDARYVYGRLLLDTGHAAEAVVQFTELSRLEPNDSDVAALLEAARRAAAANSQPTP